MLKNKSIRIWIIKKEPTQRLSGKIAMKKSLRRLLSIANVGIIKWVTP